MKSRSPAACVIGWPVAHSRSPLIHNFWLKQHGLNGEYRREAVRPEDFGEFISQLSDRGYVGANVTLPHKESAVALSQADDNAKAVGAANTLWLRHGVLHATNTDVEGFLHNLDEAARGWDRACERATVLGAGGAARAIVHGLLARGVQKIHVINRTLARGQELAERFGPRVSADHWDDLASLLRDTRLLTNTTSLGMTGQPALEVDVSKLPPQAVVSDIVYAPLQTPLLKAAQARGLPCADGLGMLLHQAVRGFSLWFEVTPKVTPELRAVVEADLAK